MGHENLIDLDLDSDHQQVLEISDEIVEAFGLKRWIANFYLMTAGYRDRLDPRNASSPDFPFNLVTVAIMVEAKARVFERELSAGQRASVHVGGEVRPHTQQFIKLAARVYAAHGFEVHLRTPVATTPIWYSSFGVFYRRLQSGDNFTASHSAFFKGGWKPMDGDGQQLLRHEEAIIAEVRSIVEDRTSITVGAWDIGGRIHHDFDVDQPYIDYQRTVLGESLIGEIQDAGREGYRVAFCPLGGSMGATSRRLFSRLGIDEQMVTYFLDDEDSEFHRVGHGEDGVEGVDPCDRRIYRNVGVQDRLASGEADIVLLSDPDGDRVKIVTTAPAEFAERAQHLGIEVEEGVIEDRCIVYLTPNQLYLVIVAFRAAALRESGDLDRLDWFVGATFPTSKSIEELATSEGIPTVRVPVGFKFLGGLSAAIERQSGGPASIKMVTGESISLGQNPRAIILCEESGGSTLGGTDLMVDQDGKRPMLALREKDGMQIILLSMALGAHLHRRGTSFLEYFFDIVDAHGIQYLQFERFDVRLYDEGLTGRAFKRAQESGNHKKDVIVDYFAKLVKRHSSGAMTLDEVRKELDERRGDDAFEFPAVLRVCSTGDGSLIEFEDVQFLLRSSGTEALLRYYVEGTDKRIVSELGRALIGLKIADAD